ncbi:MAG: acyl-CoA dehydrogenase [Bdellovibrionales bacterium RIFCSPHIGHO2_01_FULL_40_29]|nr:MAG: acyl-CoA dehydrogenase [Bdellovibrionales bacterium RIFCSPHIGHO2_01_FULL_40_29]OFZ33985.1 MAG: acyl-CoA dehydrogenase [Bdellovibrionales bacterium RIFCSPHIGHO2_02_FULL_40_15]
MKPFESVNYLDIDNLFSEEELMIRNSIRQFVTSEIMPIIAEHFEKGTFPKNLIPAMGELGMYGSTIQGYGCAGVSPTSYGLIMQELERADSGLRSFVSVQGALCMYPIFAFGTEAHRQKYLPKMATGELIGCFGLTEPDFGSNPGGMVTRAKKDGADYILNGSKMWITNGGFADLAIVWAKDDAGDIRGFIVDRETPGFKVVEIKKKFSLRASVTSELIFEDCRVPASQMLEVKGLKGPFSCLNNARFGISWGVLGAAMACYQEALEYAQTRIQFNKPIASFQLVQAKLANIVTEISKAQLLALQVGRLKDQDKAKPHQISMAKMNNVAMALNTARICRDILGASGITYEYQCGRHMLNLESVNTYEGTEDIHRLIIGQTITGISAFSN